MRTRMLRPTPWLFLLMTITGCGEVARTSAPDTTGAETDGGTTPASTLNPLSYGTAYALITNSVTMNGQAGYEVGVELTAPAPPVDRCARATRTSGACCYVPAAIAPNPGAGGGLAGKNPDGGLSFVNESAGTLTFTDASSSAALATSTYGQVPSGFGTGADAAQERHRGERERGQVKVTQRRS